MSFGLSINNENGINILTTDDFTYRVIYSEVIAFSSYNQVITRVVPGFSTTNCAAVIYHDRPATYAGDDGPYVWSLIPYMTVSGETITMRGTHPQAPANSGSAAGVSGSTTYFRLVCIRY